MCLFGIVLTEAPCLGDRPPEGFVERIPARESLQRFQSTDLTADSKSNHVPLAAVRRSLTCKQKSNVADAEKRPQEGCAAVPCAGNVVRNHRFCGQAPRYSFTKSVERKITEFARWELERLDHTKDGQNKKTRLHTVRDGQQQLDIPIFRPEAKGRGSGGLSDPGDQEKLEPRQVSLMAAGTTVKTGLNRGSRGRRSSHPLLPVL